MGIYQISINELLGEKADPKENVITNKRSTFSCAECNETIGIKNKEEKVLIINHRCQNGHKINWGKEVKKAKQEGFMIIE